MDDEIRKPYDAIKETMRLCLDEISNRKKIKNDRKGQVWIGRSEPMASFFERELAKQLSKVYTHFTFLVDYPINLQKDSKSLRKQNIYPDIIIFDKSNEKIKGIIEIKIDVGYLDLGKWWEQSRESDYKYKMLNEADTVKFKKYDGKVKNSLKLDDSVKKVFLIVTEINAHKHDGENKIPQIKRFMKDFGFEVVSLLKKTHYNDDMCVRNPDRLFKDLEQQKQEINHALSFS